MEDSGDMVVVTNRAPVAWRAILPVALAELLVQLAFADRYGYHRDELYFRVIARHPAFGYEDQPPLTPLVGRASEAIFGVSPRGLRVLSAIAVAIVVVLVALIARELGARAVGQFVAAASAAGSVLVVAVGHLLSTSTFDLLAWVAFLLVVARLLGGGDERLWLLAGAIAGIGLENKHLPLLLFASFGVGLVLDRRLVGVLRSRWLWGAVGLAALLWLPNVVWQAEHGWPQLDLAADIRRDDGSESRVGLVPFQILLLGPFLVPVWAAGLWGLLRDPRLRPWRPLGFAYPTLLVLLFASAGKPYYAGPLLVFLLAPGAVVVESWLETALRRVVLGVAIAASAVLSILVALPVVPVADLHRTPIPDINEDAAETVGWPAFAKTVGSVVARVPAPQRADTVVLAGNYGEAGAIERYGDRYGIARAYSGHNALARLGPPPGRQGPVVVVGYGAPPDVLSGCRRAATIDNRVDVDNEEQGGPVYLCSGPARPWADVWPGLVHLDA